MNTTPFAALLALCATAARQDQPTTAVSGNVPESFAPLAHVTHPSSNSVRVVNTVTKTQVASITVGSYA
jgi:hypothetical protein